MNQHRTPLRQSGQSRIRRALKGWAQVAMTICLLVTAACEQPSEPVTDLKRAATLTTSGAYTAAETAYQAARGTAPGDPAPALGLADLYLAWSRPELGLVALEEAANLGATSSDLNQRRLALLRAAGRWAEVQALAETRLADGASDLEALEALTEAHLQQHHCVAAQASARSHLDAYDMTVARDNLSPTATVLVSQTVLASARVWSTLSDDTSLLQSMDPYLVANLPVQEPDRSLALGMRLIRSGDWGLAACVLARTVEMVETSASIPNDRAAQAHAWLGEALARLGRPHEADAHLRQAIALSPELALAWLLLGQHLLAQGSLESARVALLNAQRLDPQNPAPCLNLAELKAAMGKYDEVDRWIDATLDRAPSDPEVVKAAARFYLSRLLSDTERVLKLAETAARMDPSDAEARVLVGWAHLREGNVLLAQQALTRAIDLDPNSAEAHYWQARAYSLAGDEVEAMAARTRAADLGYPSDATTERP